MADAITLTIRENILQQFPELFGTKTMNGRKLDVDEVILRSPGSSAPRSPPR